MTSDPQRLLKDTSLDDDAELERDLLRAIVDVSPPAHAQGAAWEGIATKLAAASAVAAGATVAARAASSAAQGAAATNSVAPPALSGLAHALAGKIVLGTIVAAGAVAAVGGAWVDLVAHHPTTAPSASLPRADAPPAVVSTPSVVPVAPEVEATPKAESRSPAVNDAPAVVRSAQRPHPDDGLALEGALLTDARASLRAGDPNGALAVLRRLDRQFPRGGLRQEREVLAIEALAALGDTATARRRADAFVKAHPNSPHTPLLHRLTSPP